MDRLQFPRQPDPKFHFCSGHNVCSKSQLESPLLQLSALLLFLPIPPVFLFAGIFCMLETFTITHPAYSLFLLLQQILYYFFLIQYVFQSTDNIFFFSNFSSMGFILKCGIQLLGTVQKCQLQWKYIFNCPKKGTCIFIAH